MHTPGAHLGTMALTGLSTSVLVPGLIRATRDSVLWRRLALPWTCALPLFVLLHAVVVLAPCGHLRLPPFPWWAEAVLPPAAVWFWLPVLGTRHRLTDPGRCLCLFLAVPLLDLPAVAVIALGDPLGGLTMIVSMLPLGLAAVAVTWRWVSAEERRAAGQA